MIRKISWEKKPLDRYSQRRKIEYVFKENSIEVGSFQIKGLLNREVTGQILNLELLLKDKYLPNSKWYSPKIGTMLYDNKTKECVAKITGSLSIKYWNDKIYTREISNENKEFVLQITRNHSITVFDKETQKPILNCNNPKSEQGEFSFLAEINEVILLAVFYILHQFMELNESTTG